MNSTEIYTTIFSITMTFLTLYYYYYVIKYIKDLKDIELCNKLNYPYLNIYYGIILFYVILFILSSSGIFGKLFGTNYLTFILNNFITIMIINTLINIFVIYLLYNISSQEQCKEIYPNFRTLLFILNGISLFSNINYIYFFNNKKDKKEFKDIKKYLKKSKK